MERTPFERALAFTLFWEGGFSDHPNDPGGRTFKGVTQAAWTAWLKLRGRLSSSRADVLAATPNKVRALYLDSYWTPSHADECPLPLCLAQFDAAVHSGPGRAIRLVQEAAGVTIDGIWGPKTRQAIQAADPTALALASVSRRRSFLLALVANRPNLSVFRKGWLNRLADLETVIGSTASTLNSGGN